MFLLNSLLLRVYSNLTPNELVLYIIRGINLPAPSGTQVTSECVLCPGSKVLNVYSQPARPLPSGVSPNDLDASVKFEFPFPSVVRLLHGAVSVEDCRNCAVF